MALQIPRGPSPPFACPPFSSGRRGVRGWPRALRAEQRPCWLPLIRRRQENEGRFLGDVGSPETGERERGTEPPLGAPRRLWLLGAMLSGGVGTESLPSQQARSSASQNHQRQALPGAGVTLASVRWETDSQGGRRLGLNVRALGGAGARPAGPRRGLWRHRVCTSRNSRWRLRALSFRRAGCVHRACALRLRLRDPDAFYVANGGGADGTRRPEFAVSWRAT